MSKALQWAKEENIQVPAAAENRKDFLGKAAWELALNNEKKRSEYLGLRAQRKP